jgi:hypothetical protein
MPYNWKKIWRACSRTAFKEADLLLVIGMATVGFFGFASIMLLMDLRSPAGDFVPDVGRLASIALFVAFLMFLFGLLFIFIGIRNMSLPGSFFYRLTHFGTRKH